MKPSTTEQLQSYVAELIAAGEEVVKHSGTVGTPGYSEPIVNLDLFSEWTARCGHLATLLGEHARPWNNTLRGTTQNYLGNAKYLLGTVQGQAPRQVDDEAGRSANRCRQQRSPRGPRPQV